MDKWFCILLMTIVVMVSIVGLVDNYNKRSCIMEVSKQITVIADIEKICR